MEPFASVAELQTLRPGVGDTVAELLLDLVSDSIRAGVGWPVTEVADAVLVVRPLEFARRQIPVPAQHLTQVAVVADGESLTRGDDFTVDGRMVTLLRPARDRVEVTYTAGWPPAEVPGVFRAVTLEHAAAWASNTSGVVKSWQVGSESESYFREAGAQTVIDDARLVDYTLGVAFA